MRTLASAPGINHLPVGALGMRRRMVHRDSWTGNIARDQQPDQDRGRTQAGCDQAEEKKVWTAV